MNDQTIQSYLNAIVENAILAADEGDEEMMVPDEAAGIESVRSYRDAGMMTRNAGLVIRTKDGHEYQITIVQSR